MASKTIKKNYSGRSQYELILAVSTNSTDTTNNRSRYNYRLYARSKSGHGSFVYNNGTAWVKLEGGQVTDNSAPPLTFGPSGDYAGKEITLISGVSNWRTHNSNGDLSVTIDGYSNSGGVIGSASLTQTSFAADRIPEAPGKPGTPTFSNITPTGAKASWSAGSRGHASIDNYDIDWSTNSNFSGLIDGNPGNNRTFDMTSLAPGTKYYVRTRAHNGDGWGPYSSTGSFTTLPSSAPTISISPSPTGTAATVTLAPPGGITGVSQYNIERRVSGTTTPVATASTTSVTYTASSLSPGVTYEWRANAVIGGYTSPWTSWTAQTQPSPSTNPGQFFDGNTGATTDNTYAWTGAADLSISEAIGQGVPGMVADYSGGTGALFRILGGVAGDYAARMVFFTPASSPGSGMGMLDDDPYRIDVEGGSDYFGSLYVRASREQRVAAVVTYYGAGGSSLGEHLGDEVVLAPGEYERLDVSATSPAGAEWATVSFRDVAGSGYAARETGDTYDVDAVMLSLGTLYPYFDGSFTTGFIDGEAVEFSWMGAENLSPSQGVPFQSGTIVDPLLDPDCPPVPEPPRPPGISSICIDETGVWRRYWLEIPAESISRGLVSMPRLSIFTGSEPVSQVRVRYYRSNSDTPPAEIDFGWESEQIVSYVPADTQMMLDSVFRRARAQVGGNDWRDAGHLVYSTGGLPPTWPTVECGDSAFMDPATAYAVSIDVPSDAPVGNESFALDLVVRH